MYTIQRSVNVHINLLCHLIYFAVVTELRCPDLKDDEIPANAWNSTNSTKVFTEVIWTCNDGTRFKDTTTHKKMTCQLDQSWDRKITEPCKSKLRKLQCFIFFNGHR